MSSFVIAKSEYIKTAGLLAGIAEASANSSIHQFWLYDYTTNRNMIGEDYIRVFTDLYEKNALSVAEQYGDSPDIDADEYKTVFKKACAKGKNLFYNSKVGSIIKPLNNFFQSALYQTEKEAYNWYMELVFGRIIRELISFTTSDEESSCCWGDLDGIAI